MASPSTPAQPTLAQLRVFVAVADAGGFGEAAADLGLSQSSVSEAVAKLERLLGRPLLRRTPRGTVLTDAGTRVIEHARVALLAVGDLVAAAGDDGPLEGTLRIATYRSLGVHVLPAVLGALRARHPRLGVQVMDAERDGHAGERFVASGEADVGLLQLPTAAPLLTWPLLDDAYFVVAPRERGASPVTWEELRRARLILPSGHSACHRHTHAFLTRHGVDLAGASEVEEDTVILRMVEGGLGLSFLPRLAFDPLAPGLRALPPPEPFARRLGLAVRPGRAGLPHVRAFLAAARETALALRGHGEPVR